MKRLKLVLAGISFLAVVMLPSLATADVTDFKITSFSADQTLTRQDKQGELHIVENLSVVFTDNNHGILRAIPASYKSHSLQIVVNDISSTSGAPSQYTTYNSNGNRVLKIGDPNRTVTGPQQYTIDYTVRNVISFYKDHDELYWDVNGDQWQQTFSHVSVTLHLPEDLPVEAAPSCFTGSYGSTSHICSATAKYRTVTAVTNAPLTSGQTLTYVADFDKGYFLPSKWYETLGEHYKVIAGLLVIPIILGSHSIWMWRRYGRDAPGKGTIIPQYDPPDGLKPLSMGALMDFNVDTSEITATIIDLAVRGYIKIVEKTNDRKFRKDSVDYTLELVKADFSQLDESEKLLMAKLFDNPVAGAVLDVTASKNKLYTLVGRLNSKTKSDLTAQGYFADYKQLKRPGGHTLLRVLAYFVIIVMCFIYFGVFTVGGLIIWGVIALICLAAMDARTAKGTAAREHALGLKLYLEVAEKQRLEKLQGPQADYASNANAPVKTVELFEKLLPYAMVLGVEKQWAEQFTSLYTQPPDWYSGNWNNFNALYLANSLNSGIGSAVNTAFSAPSSSGGSGSGGGGFSGGGGGGGGGGGW